MFELRDAIRLVGLIIAIVVTMLLGDLLGHKIGRLQLAAILGVTTLASIVIFTIYAAFVLL